MKLHRVQIASIYIVAAIVLSVLGLSPDAFAQSGSGLNSLEDYISVARENNPDMEAAYLNWQAKKYRAGYAGALPNPMFSFGYFIEPIETRVGPQENRFGIRQFLPWFGTLGAKKDIASFDAEQSAQRYEATYLRVIFNIKKAYYDYYLLGREIEFTKENIALLKYWESIIETRYSTGQASHSDVIQTQIERALLENHRDELLDRLPPKRQHIRELLNIETADSLPMPSQINDADVSLSLVEAQNLVEKGNPDIQAALAVIKKSEATSRLAGKASLPSFTFGVDYLQTGPALNPAMPESGKDPWVVNVSLSLPIWFGANKAKKNEAAAALHAARQQHTSTQNRIRTGVTELYGQLESARREVSLYKNTIIPQVEQLLDVVFAGYESGANDIQELLTAQRKFLDARLNFEKGRVRLAVTSANIETLLGKNVTIINK